MQLEECLYVIDTIMVARVALRDRGLAWRAMRNPEERCTPGLARNQSALRPWRFSPDAPKTRSHHRPGEPPGSDHPVR